MKKETKKEIITFIASMGLNQAENMILLLLFGYGINIATFFGSLIFSFILTIILKLTKVI